jgi:DNA-binding transcriptional regulator GbsR (MarR family)
MAREARTGVQSSSNNDRVDVAVGRAAIAVGEFIAYWGFKSIHGRLWTLLALRREPTSQVELVRACGVSRASVSSSIAELERYGLVRPTSSARNAPYVAVFDVWPTIADVLRSREWMLVESARMALESALEEVSLAQARGEPTAYDPGRLRALLGMTELAQAFLRILIRMRQGSALEAIGSWASKAGELLARVRGAR